MNIKECTDLTPEQRVVERWFVKKLVQTRNGFSYLLNMRRPTEVWRPALTSLEYFERWMLNHFIYRHDPLGGIVDNTQSVGHMFWHYKHDGGIIKGDCDDSATLYAWALKELRKDIHTPIRDVWRVNIPRYRHVICVWVFVRDGEEQYYYSSGKAIFYDTVSGDGWGSIRDVVDAYGSRKGKRKLGAAYHAEPASEIAL